MEKAEKQTLVLLVIKRSTVPRSPTSVQPQFRVQEMFRLELTFLLSIYGLFTDRISSPDYMAWSDMVIKVQLMDQMCKGAVAI